MENVYSLTMEELVEKLKKYLENHGESEHINFNSEDFKNGYARAVLDILWMVL